MRLASNPHVCCLFLLSTKSPASPRSTRYIEIPGGNGQHGQHDNPPPVLSADNQRSGASVPAPRVDCNRALIHPSGPSAPALGAQKPGIFALLFLTAFSKKQRLGESALRSKQISKGPNPRGSDTVLTQIASTRRNLPVWQARVGRRGTGRLQTLRIVFDRITRTTETGTHVTGERRAGLETWWPVTELNRRCQPFQCGLTRSYNNLAACGWLRKSLRSR